MGHFGHRWGGQARGIFFPRAHFRFPRGFSGGNWPKTGENGRIWGPILVDLTFKTAKSLLWHFWRRLRAAHGVAPGQLTRPSDAACSRGSKPLGPAFGALFAASGVFFQNGIFFGAENGEKRPRRRNRRKSAKIVKNDENRQKWQKSSKMAKIVEKN